MIIVDEGNFVDADVYLQALFPVVQQKNTIIIILTTPLGLENATSRLFDTRDENGEHIIRTVRIGASCAKCKEARVLCVHNESATGEGLSKKKRQKFMHFYKEQMHVAMREFSGEPGDSGRVMFPHKWLLELAQRKEYPITNIAKFIMIGIDPSGSGGCEWGLCACYFDHTTNTQVIIHMDAHRLDDVTTIGVMKFLKASIQTIRRSHDYFKSIPILIACEAAPHLVCENLAQDLKMLIAKKEVFNVYLMEELPNDRPGVLKTNENTQKMIALTQTMLENNQVSFSEVFTTNTKTPSGNDEECIKSQLIQQLGNVQRRPIGHVRKDGLITYRIDGKMGGQNDDLMVAFVMIIYWYVSIMGERAEKYQHIIGTTRGVMSIGGSLEEDRSTGKNKFAEGNRMKTSYRFDETPLDKNGRPIKVVATDNKRQRSHNLSNPTRQVF